MHQLSGPEIPDARDRATTSDSEQMDEKDALLRSPWAWIRARFGATG